MLQSSVMLRLREMTSSSSSSSKNCCLSPGLLKGSCLELILHLEGVEALFIEQVELLQAPAHQLHGESAGIDGCVGIKCWYDLQGKDQTVSVQSADFIYPHKSLPLCLVSLCHVLPFSM